MVMIILSFKRIYINASYKFLVNSTVLIWACVQDLTILEKQLEANSVAITARASLLVRRTVRPRIQDGRRMPAQDWLVAECFFANGDLGWVDLSEGMLACRNEALALSKLKYFLFDKCSVIIQCAECIMKPRMFH